MCNIIPHLSDCLTEFPVDLKSRFDLRFKAPNPTDKFVQVAVGTRLTEAKKVHCEKSCILFGTKIILNTPLPIELPRLKWHLVSIYSLYSPYLYTHNI